MLRSYGQVVVAAGGTPARATSNLAVPADRVGLQSLRVQVRPANAGIVYVFAGGGNFAGDHRVDRAACIAILPHPVSAVDGPFAAADWIIPTGAVAINLADIWIDAATNGDGVIISGTAG